MGNFLLPGADGDVGFYQGADMEEYEPSWINYLQPTKSDSKCAGKSLVL